MKKVGIVVVTYNRLKILKEVVESLRTQSYRNCKIIIINNGSTDDTLSWLNTQTDLITITQENVGGAGGFHTGMKYVAEHNFDFCWIMDDDVICSPNALEELLKAYSLKTNIGYVCSKVQGIDGCPMNIPSVDTRPTLNGYPHYHDMIDFQMIKIEAASFVSVLYPVNVIHELGLPYKEYFIWSDDTEYTTRISRKYDCYMACKSIVTHKRAIQGVLSFDTEKNPNRIKNYFYMIRNYGHYTMKFRKKSKRFSYIGFHITESIKYLFKGECLKSRIIIKAIWSLISFHPKIDYPQTHN